jgi:type IV pilus assembly protein PilM
MAKSNAVWGIDIGQCAIKALRCTPGEGGSVVADKYDYIEYPKILSHPDAEPDEMIREALEQFLSRNEVRGDAVAISVPGQAGLSRFFKPPPVEAKTLPDIVKYEVKQQIPFPIEDVIWDWQQLGGSIVDGRTIDAEIGLFAMKRDAVYRALKPFDDAEIDVDLVQLSPLAIFNVVTHDILDEIPDPMDIDPENPPESIVVMSMGTDTTDLIVTNGMRLWLRNIPIGGNHFTKQLSRELKLTQAKAEHLKRNAAKAEDPKAVFKAMRPVFSDLVNEVQRSLTFFQSMDKTASISRIVLLGNAAKLPGLRTFLNKQLEIDIAKVDGFQKLTGNEVIGQKSFASNVLSLAPCYGLCLQGLRKAHLKTDLLPQEIKTERIIEAKKPWVLASVGAIMLGLVMGFFFRENAWWGVHKKYEKDGKTWAAAIAEVDAQKSKSTTLVGNDLELKTKLDQLNSLNAELTSASEDKGTWIEILKAISEALPVDERLKDVQAVDPNVVPFADRKEIYLDQLESRFYPDLSVWSTSIKPIYDNMYTGKGLKAEDIAELKKLEKKTSSSNKKTKDVLEETPGYVIELKCHHYHNGKLKIEGNRSDDNFSKGEWGRPYVLSTIVDKFLNGTVTFPAPALTDEDGNELPVPVGSGEFTFADFGVIYPTIVRVSADRYLESIAVGTSDSKSESEDSDIDDGMEQGDEAGSTSDDESDGLEKAYRYDFVIQLALIPRSPQERVDARTKRLEEEAKAAEAAKKNQPKEDDE